MGGCGIVASFFGLLAAVGLVLIRLVRRPNAPEGRRSVTVFVLGDLGRSPRMQYHANSLSSVFHVDLVGVKGTTPMDMITQNKNISVHELVPFPALPRGLPARGLLFVPYAPLKLAIQILQLFYVFLFRVRKPSYFLIQNPPSLPTLGVVWIVSRLRGACFVVDWHNLGYTVLANSLNWGYTHPVIVVAKLWEFTFGALCGDRHICVTNALKKKLCSEWRVKPSLVQVLHDRPHEIFSPLTKDQRSKTLEWLMENISDSETKEYIEMLHKRDQHVISKIAMGVSSTSWTPDEDFGVLLEALAKYDSQANIPGSCLPRLLFVITGKGPEREKYEELIKDLAMTHVAICTIWLPHDKYPLVLGCSDFGVSLHQSSSQIDLPIKVLDMFGVGLPVCSRFYPCLQEELVHPGENGFTFDTSEELFTHIQKLMMDPTILAVMREHIVQQVASSRWNPTWVSACSSVFIRAVNFCPRGPLAQNHQHHGLLDPHSPAQRTPQQPRVPRHRHQAHQLPPRVRRGRRHRRRPAAGQVHKHRLVLARAALEEQAREPQDAPRRGVCSGPPAPLAAAAAGELLAVAHHRRVVVLEAADAAAGEAAQRGDERGARGGGHEPLGQRGGQRAGAQPQGVGQRRAEPVGVPEARDAQRVGGAGEVRQGLARDEAAAGVQRHGVEVVAVDAQPQAGAPAGRGELQGPPAHLGAEAAGAEVRGDREGPEAVGGVGAVRDDEVDGHEAPGEGVDGEQAEVLRQRGDHEGAHGQVGECLLWAKHGIPAHRLSILFAGRALKDEPSLADYNIQKESTVHAVLRLTLRRENDARFVVLYDNHSHYFQIPGPQHVRALLIQANVPLHTEVVSVVFQNNPIGLDDSIPLLELGSVITCTTFTSYTFSIQTMRKKQDKHLDRPPLPFYGSFIDISRNSAAAYLNSQIQVFFEATTMFTIVNVNEIRIDNLHIFEEIGSGSNGQVFACTLPNTKYKLALKKLWDFSTSYPGRTKEFDIPACFPHENISAVLATFEGHTIQMTQCEIDYGVNFTTYFLMERYPISLLAYISQHCLLPERELLLLTLQIAKGLSHLKSCGIAHRDLKLDDIMLKNGSVIIIDFGCATTEFVTTKCDGHLASLAPEIRYERDIWDFTYNDAWALGCLIYGMCKLDNPFGLEVLACPPHLPCGYAILETLAFRLLDLTPTKRLSIEDAVMFLEQALWPLNASHYQEEVLRHLSSCHRQLSAETFAGNVEAKLFVQYLLRFVLQSPFHSLSKARHRNHFALIKYFPEMGFPISLIQSTLIHLRKQGEFVTTITDFLSCLLKESIAPLSPSAIASPEVHSNTPLQEPQPSQTTEQSTTQLSTSSVSVVSVDSLRTEHHLALLEINLLNDVHLSDLRLVQKIATGTEGMVFKVSCVLASDEFGEVSYAAKVIPNLEVASLPSSQALWTPEIYDSIRQMKSHTNVQRLSCNSFDKLRKIGRHPSICHYVKHYIGELPTDWFHSGDGVYHTQAQLQIPFLVILFPYMSNTLASVMSRKSLSLNQICSFWKDILLGLVILSKFMVLHADIKPDNILISDTNKACITDFGAATSLLGDQSKNIQPWYSEPYWTTALYRPPELRRATGLISHEKADVWALGATMLTVMLTQNRVGVPEYYNYEESQVSALWEAVFPPSIPFQNSGLQYSVDVRPCATNLLRTLHHLSS
ncbi:UDP-Glycosyltransferase/glycogen phosphorylase [Pelomyxa schiedti]|nr:UDP-Glycosyltransferase/glycogen phosphorylase [Pelomyxa schiedti]